MMITESNATRGIGRLDEGDECVWFEAKRDG